MSFSFEASKFFSALASDGAINEEMLSASELDRIYGPLRQQVNESLQKQDSVMSQVQVNIRQKLYIRVWRIQTHECSVSEILTIKCCCRNWFKYHIEKGNSSFFNLKLKNKSELFPFSNQNKIHVSKLYNILKFLLKSQLLFTQNDREQTG